MRILTIRNPQVLDTPYTLISSAYSSGTTLNVEDSSGFTNDNLVLVGGVGNEKSEVTDVTANPVNKTQIPITQMGFYHGTDEPVQKVAWNKFEVQYQVSAGADWQSLVTEQLFDWGGLDTRYIHDAGQPEYYYRTRYYNSATGQYSGWSTTVPGTGLTRLNVGYLIERVKAKVKVVEGEPGIDTEILASFNAVHDIVTGLNRRWWFNRETQAYTTTEDSNYFALPSDFDEGNRVKFSLVNDTMNNEYYLKYRPLTEFGYLYQDKNASSSDYAKHYTIDLDDNRLYIGPTPATTGLVVRLLYWKRLPDLDSFSNTIPIPIPDLYVHYAAAELWDKKDNEKKATFHLKQFNNLLLTLEQMRPKSKHPRSLKTWMGKDGMSKVYGSYQSGTKPDEEW